MPDELYDVDALAWSEQQAELLRRVARGERVNDVDWEHVVEEIEDVGLSQLNSVGSYLMQMLLHLLKLRGWPQSQACDHWRGEVGLFQAEIDQRFSPSMRQRIELPRLHRRALKLVQKLRIDGNAPPVLPQTCPFTLDELLQGDTDDLEARMTAAP